LRQSRMDRGTHLHQHEEEQIIMCFRKLSNGQRCEGERTQILERGMAYMVEPMVLHGTKIVGNEKVMSEIWSPPANDIWKGLRLKTDKLREVRKLPPPLASICAWSRTTAALTINSASSLSSKASRSLRYSIQPPVPG